MLLPAEIRKASVSYSGCGWFSTGILSTNRVSQSLHFLTKPDKLAPSEWEEMKKHPEIGYRIAQSAPELSHIADYILAHHERWDGNGYSQGLKTSEIPKISRILFIVDAYDVMTHSRPYKKAIDHNEALNEIKRCSGSQFDPEIVEVFLKLV